LARHRLSSSRKAETRCSKAEAFAYRLDWPLERPSEGWENEKEECQDRRQRNEEGPRAVRLLHGLVQRLASFWRSRPAREVPSLRRRSSRCASAPAWVSRRSRPRWTARSPQASAIWFAR